LDTGGWKEKRSLFFLSASQGQMITRSREIDVCRGLLFLLMINTHALTLASVSKDHWLFSDLWLPNGWATVAFVVLSGYGIGYIFSTREQAKRDAALIKRGRKILAVMFVSNCVFCALSQAFIAEQPHVLLTRVWWLGIFTLTTKWTISGVLLPTGLVLLLGPVIIRFCQRAFYITLAVLAATRFIVALLVSSLESTGCADSWILQLLFFNGLGGFPVLPFVLNGFLGIWLGMFRHRQKTACDVVLGILMLVQVLIYLSSLNPQRLQWVQMVSPLGAITRFAWIFALALLLARLKSFPMTSKIELIGKFSLGSFIMHRVFLNVIHIVQSYLVGSLLPPSYYYCILIIGALVLTWFLCFLRERFPAVNRCFTRLSL